MNKHWLNNYPEGIPHEIKPEAFSSIIELFKDAVKKFARKPALVNFGCKLSYRKLDKLSKSFAAYCQNHLKLQKGERLAIMLPNIMQYFVVLLGALRAGLTVVNVNPLYTPRELTHQIKDAGAENIVVLANFLHTAQEAMTNCQLKNVIVTEVGDLLSKTKSHIVNFAVRRKQKIKPNYNEPYITKFCKALKLGKKAKFTAAIIKPEDIAFLQYTGGTTGVAKGAILTHRNIIANVEQTYAWMSSALTTGKETVITALPLYHIFALLVNCFLFLKTGAKNILITNPSDIRRFTKEIAKYKFTAITGVNTLFKALLSYKKFHQLNFKHLKIALGGGMAVHRQVAEKWQNITGSPLLEGYGLTECSPVVCCTPLHLKSYHGSTGLPIPSTEVRIVNKDNQPLSINEIGELQVRGPQVMQGYWNQEAETAQVLLEDGWLKTGDIAKIDESGHVYIVDREKDMIIVSGYNVYPNEIERVISKHPGVLEVAIIGEKHEKRGEIIKACIVKKDPQLSRQDIIHFCRDQLTDYKIPRKIEFHDSLPKTNVGKISRLQLR